MIVIALLLAVALPTVLGMVCLAALEGRTPLLTHVERAAIGFTAGATLLMYAAFLGSVTLGIPFSRMGFLGSWLLLMIIAGCIAYFRGSIAMLMPTASSASAGSAGSQLPHPNPISPLWARTLVLLFALSVAARIILGGVVAATTPPFFDDTLNNWNMRGKLYYVTQHYELRLPLQRADEAPSTLSAYPPMLPLMKTFTAALAGQWSDGLVDVLQLSWLIVVLAMVWSALRRVLGNTWALLGASALGSLPLFLMQGVNAYSDIAMAAHIAAVLTLLFQATRAEERSLRTGLLRVSIVLAALMPFVKNEGLLLYLPVFVLCCALVVWNALRTYKLEMWDIYRLALSFGIALMVLVLPWLIFKWMNGMPFGNAKSVTGLSIAWQPGVLQAIGINTFFEGNWNMLFPLFLGLLAYQWKAAFRMPLLPITLFVLMLWLGQVLIFLFTSLSYEALFQTGYARGLIHLVPLIVVLTVLLLRESVKKSDR